MKFKFLFLILLVSCNVPNYYYQVYKTNPENGSMKDDKVVFEDNNCIVYYDLWKNGGDVGFSIYNKTDNDVVVDLKNTFFVLNGVAYTYFQNRTISNTINTGVSYQPIYPYRPSIFYTTSVVTTTSNSNTISYIEKDEQTIPSKTRINVAEFQVVNSRFKHCDLILYPSRNKIKTLNFNKDNTPFSFYNIISYKSKNEVFKLENKFFVSEITNYPESVMFNQVDTTSCGTKFYPPSEVFQKSTPNKFYLKYEYNYR